MSIASAVLLDRLAPGPASSPRAARGAEWLTAHGLPTVRNEAWRYSPLDAIGHALGKAQRPPDTSPAISRSTVDELAGDHGGLRLVFVNGVLDSSVSDLGSTGDGLLLTNGAGMRRRPRRPGSAEDQPADGFHALNWAAGRDVAAVIVDPDAQRNRPVHIVHVAAPGDDSTVNHPRTVALVGSGARLHLIESYVGMRGPSITNASTRIVAGTGSVVTHHRIQDEASTAIHIGRTAIESGAGSTVRATSIMSGGRIARSAIEVIFVGPDASAEVDGLYLACRDQRHDNVVKVVHGSSNCSSTQAFKGIIDDRARGSFSGHVVVRPGTTGTSAHQSNRNLVLTPTAQADTRPWLEILADDVRCTHGATVGRLDDAALFYLRSRGIPLEQGRAMLVAAFAAEVIDTITPTSLRARVATLAALPGGG